MRHQVLPIPNIRLILTALWSIMADLIYNRKRKRTPTRPDSAIRELDMEMLHDTRAFSPVLLRSGKLKTALSARAVDSSAPDTLEETAAVDYSHFEKTTSPCMWNGNIYTLQQ
ncbi:predicted protein [Histoplasma capsulatum var. duboisii H88]|uniref:Predicted protein n=1 Tax=Ajellomyces capsulatus (strain H88) TaxID=544711 RepID=F0UKM6_AJEC8|nr:predicted protein [Histoplasma capsulatum var. duboisii H88]